MTLADATADPTAPPSEESTHRLPLSDTDGRSKEADVRVRPGHWMFGITQRILILFGPVQNGIDPPTLFARKLELTKSTLWMISFDLGRMKADDLKKKEEVKWPPRSPDSTSAVVFFLDYLGFFLLLLNVLSNVSSVTSRKISFVGLIF